MRPEFKRACQHSTTPNGEPSVLIQATATGCIFLHFRLTKTHHLPNCWSGKLPNPPNRKQVALTSSRAGPPSFRPWLVWQDDDARPPPLLSIWAVGSTTTRRCGSRDSSFPFCGASVAVEAVGTGAPRTPDAPPPVVTGERLGQSHDCYIMASKVLIAARVLDSADALPWRRIRSSN